MSVSLDNSHVLVVPPAEGEFTSSLLLITLDQLTIRDLFSGGLTEGNVREGFLAMTMNGATNETVLSWSGAVPKKRGTGKPDLVIPFREVLFLGSNDGLIEVGARLVESDEKDGQMIGKIITGLGIASAVAGAAPGPGSIVSGGLGVASAILRLVKGGSQKDTELRLECSIGSLGTVDESFVPLRTGTYHILRKRPNTPNSDADIDIQFSIHDFNVAGAGAPQPEAVAVVLEKITVEAGKVENNGKAVLVFEAAFGVGKTAQQTSFTEEIWNNKSSLGQVMGIQNAVVYSGPFNTALPFALSMALVKDDKERELIDGVINSATSYARTFVKRKESKATAEGWAKASESVRAGIIELLPKKLPIGKMSGLLTTKEYAPPEGAGNLVVAAGLSKDRWDAFSVKLSEQGRSATLHFKVIEIEAGTKEEKGSAAAAGGVP